MPIFPFVLEIALILCQPLMRALFFKPLSFRAKKWFVHVREDYFYRLRYRMGGSLKTMDVEDIDGLYWGKGENRFFREDKWDASGVFLLFTTLGECVARGGSTAPMGVCSLEPVRLESYGKGLMVVWIWHLHHLEHPINGAEEMDSEKSYDSFVVSYWTCISDKKSCDQRDSKS